MDSINFLGKTDFPNSVQTMDMLQGMIRLAAYIGSIGGSNYILTGCEEDAEMVSAGKVVINGIPYEFAGGAAKPNITIKETKTTLSAFGVEYPEARTKRVVEFSDTGEYKWADFEKVPTNYELKALFQSIKGDMPGIIKMWAGQVSKIPVGYKLCNGDELAIKDYPELFETLGVSFGGDGLSSFKLPDLRGKFVVGYNNTNGSDYDSIGKTGGLEKVQLVIDELPTFNPANNDTFNKLSARAADVSEIGTPGSIDPNSADKEYNVGNMTAQRWDEATIKDIGDDQPHENRPPFFTLAYIIKVTV